MSDPRRQPESRQTRSDRMLIEASSLPMTADAARGSSNLATIPRAGNISTDTRAGTSGWPRVTIAPGMAAVRT